MEGMNTANKGGIGMSPGPILIYGFGPYDEFERNITSDVIDAIPTLPGLTTITFETRFDRAMFERCLTACRPATIIGLGQHRHARKLRLERRAVNRKGKRGGPLTTIDPQGPAALAVNLHLPDRPFTTVAYDAGTYVCNFSMYVMLQYCALHEARFGFIHVPLRFDVATLTDYLKQALRTTDA